MKLCPSCKNTYPDDYQVCPRDQAQLAVLGAEIVPGTVLRGKYEVIAELGVGGMATVYKARHQAFQDFAAIKVVHAHFMHDPSFIKRFRNEAIVARQLRHPNAVRIDDFDYTEDGRPFIVMEFVDGSSLYEVRKAHPGPWPVERCLNIIAQAVEALGAAHTLGIVHRDIKPSNIILLRNSSGEGQVKVLDFGIAKVSNGSFDGMTSVLTQQSLIIGTPEYMSPEQASGRIESGIDGRADLYSLGLVLYEMLTGSHPFQADTPMGMLIQQINTVPPPPESVGPNVPPAISALVLKALQKDPKSRFQRAAEMLAALRDPQGWYAPRIEVVTPRLTSQSLTAYPVPTSEKVIGPDTPIGSTRSFPKKYFVFVAAVFLVLASVGVLLAHYFLLSIQPSARQAPPSVTPSPVRAPDTAPSPKSNPVSTVATTTVAKITAPPTTSIPPRLNTPHVPERAGESAAEAKPSASPPPAAGVGNKTSPSSEQKVDTEALLKQAFALMRQQRYAEAYPLSKSACDAGSLPACVNLGYMFENGKAVPQDYARAFALYRKSCDGGSALGCSNLGEMYQHGRGVPQDFNQAFTLFHKGCDAGNSHGCSRLGYLYETGKGASQDYAKAVALYRIGCDDGFAIGCSNLGHMYEAGKGVAADYVQAIALYRKSCDGEYAPGCGVLGLIYVMGKGVSRDYGRAAPLFRKSCDGGYAPGCANLGVMYLRGDGVTRDKSQAISLYRKGCDLGLQSACDKVTTIHP
jgi:eukaryotic-like serine/threonine-protein kinase